MPKELPKTRARLSSSITIRAALDLSFLDEGAGRFQNLAQLIGLTKNTIFNAERVGAVTKMSRAQTRSVMKRYALGTYSFEPFQIVPGRIDTKLTLDRVELYKSDTLTKYFAFLPRHLLFQQLPFLIVEDMRNPDGSSFTIIYNDCWITSNPIAYDIMGDQIIMRQFNVEVGKMLVLDDSVTGVSTTLVDGLASLTQVTGTALNLAKDVGLQLPLNIFGGGK